MNQSITETLIKANLPKHVAIIMDGNGRWAKQKGKDRTAGHQEGVNSVKEVIDVCGELGIPYLTLFAFSTENWKRPKMEVDFLMSLLIRTLRKEIDELQDRKSTRLNSSHVASSYAVFCLKKKRSRAAHSYLATR